MKRYFSYQDMFKPMDERIERKVVDSNSNFVHAILVRIYPQCTYQFARGFYFDFLWSKGLGLEWEDSKSELYEYINLKIRGGSIARRLKLKIKFSVVEH